MKREAKKVRDPQTFNHNQSDYENFDLLNGSHPWMQKVPEGFVAYKVRQLNKGTVLYFNFDLAKEMNLIPKNHPSVLNKLLIQKLLDIFSVQIINEYDRIKKNKFPYHTIKPNEYMATRYLQLQHNNKQGLTSGDGRSIWNGTVQGTHFIWDVSSRGTGVTRLAPGSSQSDKPLRTGNNKVSYGCGKAEIDEMLSTALMSEIFHKTGIYTERTLLVISLDKHYGIGVRAAPNLIRPAHLFLHLKQRNLKALKRATDYFIDRQFKNGFWLKPSSHFNKYDFMLKEISIRYAEFVAYLERQYIFVWLDWDGDNVLAHPGIIDYGSIRQFGLRHDQYRYEDIDRFSANLNEQRFKAKLIVKIFTQLIEFIKTGKKISLTQISNHPSLKLFDLTFKRSLLEQFLFQFGFRKEVCGHLVLKERKKVELLYDHFLYFEKIKSSKKMGRVEDGVNRRPVFNMRKAILIMIKLMKNEYTNKNKLNYNIRTFYKQILATVITKKDRQFKKNYKPRFIQMLTLLQELIKSWQTEVNLSYSKICFELEERSKIINRSNRITGNSITLIIDEILMAYKKGASLSTLQSIMDLFIESQVLNPDYRGRKLTIMKNDETSSLWQIINQLTIEYSEDI